MTDPIDRCLGCHAQIAWVTTTYGRRLPLDVRAAETGNLVFVDAWTVAVIDPAMLPGRTRYRAHYCPSGLWRGVSGELATS